MDHGDDRVLEVGALDEGGEHRFEDRKGFQAPDQDLVDGEEQPEIALEGLGGEGQGSWVG